MNLKFIVLSNVLTTLFVIFVPSKRLVEVSRDRAFSKLRNELKVPTPFSLTADVWGLVS